MKMNSNLFLSTLGLARRANKLFYGFDSVCENLKQISAIYLSNDLSDKTRKSIFLKANDNHITLTELNYTKNELGNAIGTKPVGIIGVADEGFAKILNSRIKEETVWV